MSKNYTTYPNQKVIHINKPDYMENYLTIGIEEWAEASKNLSPNTFKLYLYCASNADGFDLALSRQAVINLLGISKDSYIRGVKELEDKHYFVQKQGNIYDFYTKPMYATVHTLNEENDVMYATVHTPCMQQCIQYGSNSAYSMYADMHTEINKINKINKTNNMASDEALAANAAYSANADCTAAAVYNKWIPKDDKSNEIFGSDIHSDKRVLEIIREEYKPDNWTGKKKTPEEVASQDWCTLCNVNQEKIIEYITEVLDKEN